MNLMIERQNLVFEYIEQIMTDTTPVHGKIYLDKVKIENKNRIVLDIFVPTKQFERHYNLGIEGSSQCKFYFLIINELYKRYSNMQYVAVSNLYSDTENTKTISVRNAVNGIDIIFGGFTKKTKEMLEKIEKEKHEKGE